jgi:hypothetical protein
MAAQVRWANITSLDKRLIAAGPTHTVCLLRVEEVPSRLRTFRLHCQGHRHGSAQRLLKRLGMVVVNRMATVLGLGICALPAMEVS